MTKHCIRLCDLFKYFENYRLPLDVYDLNKYFKELHKDRVAATIFGKFITLVIEDVLERGVMFYAPYGKVLICITYTNGFDKLPRLSIIKNAKESLRLRCYSPTVVKKILENEKKGVKYSFKFTKYEDYRDKILEMYPCLTPTILKNIISYGFRRVSEALSHRCYLRLTRHYTFCEHSSYGKDYILDYCVRMENKLRCMFYYPNLKDVYFDTAYTILLDELIDLYLELKDDDMLMLEDIFIFVSKDLMEFYRDYVFKNRTKLVLLITNEDYWKRKPVYKTNLLEIKKENIKEL